MTKHRLVLVLISLTLMLFNISPVFAFGISPGVMSEDNLLPGSSMQKTVQISRSDASLSQMLTMKVTGDAAKYIHLPQGAKQVFPAKQTTIDFPITIEPENLGEGTYSAFLTVELTNVTKEATTDSSSGDSPSAGISMLTGARMDIRFTVTNTSLERYTVSSFLMQDTEVKQKMVLAYTVNNSGNVDTRPAKIDFTFTDVKDPTNTFAATVDAKDIPITAAFKEQQIRTVLPYMEIKTGNYKATAIFYDKNGEVIYTGEVTLVQVFPEGTLAQEGELTDYKSDKTHYEDGEVVQLTATFKNTGTIGTEATFVTEIYQGDKRIDVIKQDPIYVPMGRETEFDQDYNPVLGGDYTAKAYAQYGVTKTKILETSFSVGALSPFIIGGVLGGVCLVILLLLFWWHRRNKNKAGLTTKTPKTAKKTAGKKKK